MICLNKYQFLVLCLALILTIDVIGILSNQDLQELELVIGSVVTIAGFVIFRLNGNVICLGETK